eukprot:CAMPEP_0176491456 /NCGR_PEP_ID=MMETSP0200_2-20121128/8441_1 /TAXON_ID=947934 /ORGANISM="Chaetoceros sp., Strain GSL56" /LENGTH=166 /DNA_ID=CAMNT_0017888885 /DNA_START=93 /DNA_END=593 /DNA_ORIENTATION=-
MKFESLILLTALIFNVSHAFTTSNQACQRKALITSRKTTTIRAAASAGGEKKKKATKKKAAVKDVKKEIEKEEVETVRKPEFVASIAEKTGMSKTDSEAALAAVIETITENVAAGKRISMLGFGTFKLTSRAARVGRNPKTGEEIQIKASKTPSFSAGKAFKEKCN